MRFSVVVPVYNVEKYVRACLESVCMQTFDDFEVVIVNDGSSDQSLYICKDFAKKNAIPIRIVSQDNRGLLLARRAGIDAARGDYVVCLDADDELRHDALEVIDGTLKATNADVLLFQASRDEEYSVPYLNYEGLYSVADAKGLVPEETVKALLATTHNVHNMCGKAIKREHVGQGVDYASFGRLQYGEDLLQTMKVFDTSRVFVVIPDILYYYRDNRLSISHGVNKSRIVDISVVRNRLLAYAERWNHELVPFVKANSCVEVLAYCAICSNRLRINDACIEIGEVIENSFFRESVEGADFSLLPAWKRIGIGFLEKRRVQVFVVYTKLLFSVLRLVRPNAASRYL